MTAPTRIDGRQAGELRPVTFERDFTKHAPGSVLVSFGDTRVVCTASYDERIPKFRNPDPRRGEPRRPKLGWLTAGYAMLPGSTSTRKERDIKRGHLDGRSAEIQRLIGRSLRSVVAWEKAPKMIYIDCDVLQADGGTRTASISGAWVALYDLLAKLQARREIGDDWPLERQVAAVSVGVVKGEVLCDLCDVEDKDADTDMNLVMTDEGHFLELQGTAERAAFSKDELDGMLEVGTAAVRRVFEVQRAALGIA